MTSLEVLGAAPYRLLADMRESAPAVFVDELGGWVVTRYDAAVDVMRRPDVFTVDDPRFTTGQVIGPSMLSLDGTEHSRHRSPFVPPYRLATIEREAAGWVRRRAETLVDSLNGSQFELRAQLAAPLAAETILMTLSLAADSDQALGWYQDIVNAVDELSAGNDLPPEGPAAFQSLLGAVAATPDGDSDVLADARRTLSGPELAANVAVVMFGAIETTEGAVANLLWHLLTTASLELAGAEPDLLDSAIEESLRLEPSASRVDRYATTDADICGVAIPGGDLVIVSLLAANRDPAVFDDPDTFRIDRANAARHLTFARGPHACLGAHLARLEMAATVSALGKRFEAIRLDAEGSAGPAGLVFRKAQRLVVAGR